MSSDSEDDCYGNIAQRLQSMKSKYREDKIKTTNLLIKDLKEKTDNSWRKNDSITSEKDCNLSVSSDIGEEYSLDAIIAKNSKKRALRNRNAVSVDNILPETATRSKRTRKSEATTSQCNTTTQNAAPTSQSVVTCQSDTTNETSVTETVRGRGRGRGRRSRGRGQPNSSSRNKSNKSRGRGRNSCSDSWTDDMYNQSLYDLMAAMAASAAMMSTGPVYSVGNTDEYPDQSDDQPLFNSSRVTAQDVVVIDNEPELDENEELSVKVYWQSSEHVKFNIRRFQKLTQIFDHFAKRENVDPDKLLFTYNDKILKSDDTPDSINYSIVKFIDGGIVNQSVSSIVRNDSKDDGIKLKFQCQNVKKPFVMRINPDDKMSVVMMKCAEHLEKPLEALKFYFDGDLLCGKQTAKELEMEGGECIDVKTIS